ncbi:Methanol:corrinoid methyltransferase [Candidatus Sulfopaludibacter sp. SbA3]|nr:Methanol:corrinoid methyltransferase [Candidatus Sulfopaludibacter sp. SbA3]
MQYKTLAIPDPQQLIYGWSPHPVRCGFDLEIGGGLVFPEVNFTLPAIEICAGTWGDVMAHYEEMAGQILRRAIALQVPGIVLEFELLPRMTSTPEWGAEITALLHRHLAEAFERHGLRSALRVTPTDIRDQARPPVLREGGPWDSLKRSFELCIEAGADIVSIESIGGKELHDPALMYGDIEGIAHALGVAAPDDTAWLWDQIAGMCASSGHAIAGGDSACGFANTAMQLAHQKMLPEVLAAVVRAMSAVRSLVAFEHGAVGPSKDCAYEGPILKAITGCPISMEGKSATCAHFSPLGNIAASVCDLWSNESVQNVRLLSGNAPEAYTELLAYDCRLMNVAASRGQARMLRDWLCASDEDLSPQAAVLSLDATIRIAQSIVDADTPYERTIAAGLAAVCHLRERIGAGKLQLAPKEAQWLDRIGEELSGMQAGKTDDTRRSSVLLS